MQQQNKTLIQRDTMEHKDEDMFCLQTLMVRFEETARLDECRDAVD